MKVQTIETGFFKLDGGAMYGLIPKSMWNKKNPADENNMCTWSMRCMLVEKGDRKILIDAGMGEKLDSKFMSFFYPHGEDSLKSSIAKAGLTPEDITDVFITHLHFDHVGGATEFGNDKNIVPTFPNAQYWSNKEHYDWAFTPNARERASFIKDNFVPLSEEGILNFLDDARDEEWIDGISLKFVNGHTQAMMLPLIKLNNGKSLLYCADLFPSASHISMPWVMAYDVQPLVTLQEKEIILNDAIDNDYILFFEHDPVHQCGTVKRNERGRIVIDETFALSELG